MLDLFSGRLGWSKPFLARGWEVIAVDLVRPPDTPPGCTFIKADIMNLRYSGDFASNNWFLIENGERRWIGDFDFICASSPCDEFSCWTMKMFQPNPKYPELGIQLFNHTRAICETSGVPYVMENTRGAVQFVGKPVGRCGPFYLWGNGVPPILPQGITKSKWKPKEGRPGNFAPEWNMGKVERKATMATIPPELANCVVDYAEALLRKESPCSP